jgi:glycosyltransferase involved in cell wall biosynthesis
MKAYILITPARNEAAFLPGVLNSVLAQSVRPLKWVIVSDGSTDDTDELVTDASRQHAFIQLISLEPRGNRSFASKAMAFRKGYDALLHLSVDYVGNLDADVTLEPHYYKRILEEMEKNSRLGVAGGVVWDKTARGFKRTTSSLNHAVGAVQFWRKDCFEEAGGYRPATVGGVDSLAELTARMKGWETRSFPDLPIYHHKPVDSLGGGNAYRIAYRAGLTEYHIGTHPLFAFFKALRRWKDRPVLAGLFIRFFAYCTLWLTNARRDASDELVAYLKHEQMQALQNALLRYRRHIPHPERYSPSAR